MKKIVPMLGLALLLTAKLTSAAGIAEEDRFTLLDADDDASITWQEFSTVNTNISRQGFDLLDSNQDGELSLDEWLKFTAAHGSQIPMSTQRQTMPAKDPEMPLLAPPHAPEINAQRQTMPPLNPGIPLIMPPRTPETNAAIRQ